MRQAAGLIAVAILSGGVAFGLGMVTGKEQAAKNAEPMTICRDARGNITNGDDWKECRMTSVSVLTRIPSDKLRHSLIVTLINGDEHVIARDMTKQECASRAIDTFGTPLVEGVFCEPQS